MNRSSSKMEISCHSQKWLDLDYSIDAEIPEMRGKEEREEERSDDEGRSDGEGVVKKNF